MVLVQDTSEKKCDFFVKIAISNRIVAIVEFSAQDNMRMYYENKSTNNPPKFLLSPGNKNLYRQTVNSPIKEVFE